MEQQLSNLQRQVAALEAWKSFIEVHMQRDSAKIGEIHAWMQETKGAQRAEERAEALSFTQRAQAIEKTKAAQLKTIAGAALQIAGAAATIAWVLKSILEGK